MYKIKRYFQGVIKQAKMVRWPKKIELLQAFGVVMVILVISALALALDDFVIANLLKTLDNELLPPASSSGDSVPAAIRTLFIWLK